MSTFLHSGKLKRLRMSENFAKVLLFVLLSIATYVGQSAASVFPAPGEEDVIADQNKEMAQFFKAKEELFKQDWAGAKAGLEQYLKDYPSGRLADEALYWIAQCSNRLSKAETDSARVITLKETAVENLNDLISRFGQSLWNSDASALRKEISRDLALFGLSDYRSYAAPEAEEKPGPYGLASVLRALGDIQKEAAFSLAQVVYASNPSGAARSAAAFFLGQYFRRDALPFLESAAKTDPDENVRKTISTIIDRVRMSLVPVRMKFYAFYTQTMAEPEFSRIREHTINLFELPHIGDGDSRGEELIRSRFKNIGTLKNKGYVEDLSDYIYMQGFYSYHDYIVNLVNADLKKEPERISGKVVAVDRHPVDEHEYTYRQAFEVTPERDALVALRSGSSIDFLLVQFEPTPISDSELLPKSSINFGPDPARQLRVLKTDLKLLGCTIHASSFIPTLRSNPPGDYPLDMGPAIAEIPGDGGGWKLEGKLLCDQKTRVFIGRQFTLTDPQGKVVAKGAYIEVPADNPQSYRTSANETKSRFAVILSPELINLVERRSFAAGKLLEFKIGTPLSDALTREVMKYDGTASIRDSEPASGEFERVFKFSIDRAGTGLKRLGDSYIGGINKNDVGGTEFGDLASTQSRMTIPQRYAIAVRFEVLDGRTMKPILSELIRGFGVYNQQRQATTSKGGMASPETGVATEFEAKKLKKACDDAISQVAASLAKVLSHL